MRFALDWDEKPGNKFSVLRIRQPLDMRDQTNWPRAQDWLLEKMRAVGQAFRARAKQLTDPGTLASSP